MIGNLDKEVPTALSPSEAVNSSTCVEEEREDENRPAAESKADKDEQGEEIFTVNDNNVAENMKILSQYLMQKGMADGLLTKVADVIQQARPKKIKTMQRTKSRPEQRVKSIYGIKREI
ncbi:hypothetical protein PoB_007653600 [Plakobranchus ocellatus]|uniref:Uncharacterized protein n=1 Tax=Plakobranchus ocellatus TaxID=259542 RepID=A0AAV4E132_9GAST|nr:hypothetical protein PoB_007653600 [Plakobranchus ocellatus]